ncbi:MAG: hydroxyacid dehydrogenase [Anaerolineae bacterium]
MLDKVVLVNNPIHPAALDRLASEVEVRAPYDATPEEARALLLHVHGVVLGFDLFMGPAELDLAEKLEVIGRHGVGLDNVDVPAATERRIPVTFTPYGPTESTAEHALLLMLATARRLPQLDRAVRTGDFGLRARPEAMGHELVGKVLGVVGFGRIGRRLAEMCRAALQMPVCVFDPFLSPSAVTDWGGELVHDLVELASRVDVLSIHVPLSPETHHLIDAEVLNALKPGSLLINCSRGPVVEEGALVRALRSGHLAGAGLDVYDPEPPISENPLFEFDQVVLTPHVASCTHEGRLRMGLTVVEDVLRVLRGERPDYLANPEVWSQRRRPNR